MGRKLLGSLNRFSAPLLPNTQHRDEGTGFETAVLLASFSPLSIATVGTFMIVEPIAADSLAENINPVGRVYYGFSTMVCTPASLSQEVGLALGAQAGERRLREVLSKGGFTRFRRATETPFNMILEARP